MNLRIHAPGHVRDTAVEAFEAWMAWNGISPEPTVEFEVKLTYAASYLAVARDGTGLELHRHRARAYVFDALVMEEMPVKSRTYAACARAILDDIKSRKSRKAA